MAKQYGKWVVQRSLSEGGQAHTFLVFNPEVGEQDVYVLKRFRNRDRLLRFENEVKAALALQHPNLVRQIEFDLVGEKPYIVTEYYSGGSLSNANFSGWSILERLRLFREICEGVSFAHSRGIIHRDLKPDNIFIKSDRRTPVVGDFGICFFLDAVSASLLQTKL